jgi:hypothetical protein
MEMAAADSRRVLRSLSILLSRGGKHETSPTSLQVVPIAAASKNSRCLEISIVAFAYNYLHLAHNGFRVSFTTSAGGSRIAAAGAKSWKLRAKSSKRNARNSFAVYSL